MIQVALLNGTPGVKRAKFLAVPLGAEDDFRCEPPGVLSLESAQLIAKELAGGITNGRIDGYYWYWQAGTLKGRVAQGSVSYERFAETELDVQSEPVTKTTV